MKYYFLTAHETHVEVIGKFAVMKEDWETLSFNQQVGCVTKLFGDCVFSTENQQKVAQFVRTLNCPETNVGSMKLTRTDRGNMFEFMVVTFKDIPSVMAEMSEEEYSRFLEDAQDEAEK